MEIETAPAGSPGGGAGPLVDGAPWPGRPDAGSSAPLPASGAHGLQRGRGQKPRQEEPLPSGLGAARGREGPRGAGRSREGHSERGEALLFFRVSASRGRGCAAVGPGRPAVGRPFSLAEEARPHACAVNPQCSLFLPAPRHLGGHSTRAAGLGLGHSRAPLASPRKGRPGAGRAGVTVARTGFEVRI